MKVENTSDRQYDVHSLPKGNNADGVPHGDRFSIPRATMGPGDVGKINGVGEIPDDVLSELLAKDEWTKAVFASGHLVAKGVSKSADPGPAKPTK
jgi:hypothetical protein